MSVKNPTLPRLMPKKGTSKWNRPLIDPIIVPSPPITINRSGFEKLLLLRFFDMEFTEKVSRISVFTPEIVFWTSFIMLSGALEDENIIETFSTFFKSDLPISNHIYKESVYYRNNELKNIFS